VSRHNDPARGAFARACGATIKTYRGNLSRTKLAERTGISPARLASFEQGRTLPDAWELGLLAEGLNFHHVEGFWKAIQARLASMTS
jgi:transcriptional regulator with XRE-family HTH domain